MIVCTQCSRENEENHNFCLGCGANLKAQRVVGADASQRCPGCGAELAASHLFCGRCGTQLRRETSDVASVPEKDSLPPPPGDTAEPQARLVLINPDGSAGEAVTLKPGENVLGSAVGPELFRQDPYLSPRHCVFLLDGQRLEVRDLGSLNGIFFRIGEPTELRHRDLVRIGRQLLRFEVLDQCAAVVGREGAGAKVLGAPRGGAWGRLVRVSAPDRNSRAYLLATPEEVIGRERGTILIRDDGFVSGRHARITHTGGRHFLDDLRSSNGTFLNVRARRVVENGDLLLIGQQPVRATLV